MSNITKIGFPSILSDNEIAYINYIYNITQRVCNASKMQICKGLSKYSISILPASNELKNALIEEITIAHDAIGITIEYSKSIKISTHISWEIKCID